MALNTPLTIAYCDPVLRAQGLSSDQLGHAMSFFELRPAEAHFLLCDCHEVGAVSGQMLAEREAIERDFGADFRHA